MRLPGSPGSLFDNRPLPVWKRRDVQKLFLIAALALASCGDTETANNAAVADETSANAIQVSADATAIDAATGQAANMAADVDYTFNDEFANEAAANAATNAGANNSL